LDSFNKVCQRNQEGRATPQSHPEGSGGRSHFGEPTGRIRREEPLRRATRKDQEGGATPESHSEGRNQSGEPLRMTSMVEFGLGINSFTQPSINDFFAHEYGGKLYRNSSVKLEPNESGSFEVT